MNYTLLSQHKSTLDFKTLHNKIIIRTIIMLRKVSKESNILNKSHF